MTRRNDRRARGHAAYWAFRLQRVSGVLLALFLPLHFAALGVALRGEIAFDSLLRYTDDPLLKVGEWVLVVLLSLHLLGGLRVLALEFLPWSGPHKDWIAAAAAGAFATGLAFALALIG